MTTVRSRSHLVTGERVRLGFLESSNDCCHQLELEDYSERAMKIVLVAWVARKAGMQCSIRSSSIFTVPYSMKTLQMCSSQLLHLVFCSRNGDLLVCYSATKMRICCTQFHCIEVNVPGTNFSIK